MDDIIPGILKAVFFPGTTVPPSDHKFISTLHNAVFYLTFIITGSNWCGEDWFSSWPSSTVVLPCCLLSKVKNQQLWELLSQSRLWRWLLSWSPCTNSTVSPFLPPTVFCSPFFRFDSWLTASQAVSQHRTECTLLEQPAFVSPPSRTWSTEAPDSRGATEAKRTH